MILTPKREYILLLLGDVVVFVISLWMTLALRYMDLPGAALFKLHVVAFAPLFAIWIGVFFLAGLYAKHTRIFRERLPATVIATQVINVVIAGAFFFFVPLFGLAPKTILLIYLLISSPLIVLWRVFIYGRLPLGRPEKGILIAGGPDAKHLADELKRDKHFRLEFITVLDTGRSPSHEIIQQVCRLAEKSDITFLAADFSDDAVSVALPLIYDAAFRKRQFSLVDVRELYQEVFDRVPLSLVNYEWVLENLRSSRVYDLVKRFIDVLFGVFAGLSSLVIYPFVICAIKLDDGGPVFISQERVGRFQQPIRILKFRSMTGNDSGNYGSSGKTELRVTRVGKWLRLLRIDELPQLWNVVNGDLSFVGPRPELPTLANHYSARIPYYNARYLITPGLAGWAQLRHDRHPHHGAAVEDTKEKLSYDLYYLKRRSLLLDIYIMLQTIKVVLTARGS